NDKAQALECSIELFEIEWLRQIDVCAVFLRRLFHAVDVVSRNGDNGRVISVTFELAEVFDSLQTIQHRHIQIDNNQARMIAARHIERLLTVFGLKNVIAFQFKGPLEHKSSVDRIFGNEYGRIKYCRHDLSRAQSPGLVTKLCLGDK